MYDIGSPRFHHSQWLILLILVLAAFGMVGHLAIDATCLPGDSLQHCLDKKADGVSQFSACCALHACFLLPHASTAVGLPAPAFALTALDIVFFTQYLRPPIHPPDASFRLA